MQELHKQALVDSILNDVVDVNSEEEDESVDEDNSLPPLKEQLRILALAKRLCVSS